MNTGAKISAFLAMAITYLLFLGGLLAVAVWIVAKVWGWATA